MKIELHDCFQESAEIQGTKITPNDIRTYIKYLFPSRRMNQLQICLVEVEMIISFTNLETENTVSY